MSNANEIKISKGTIAMLFYVSKLLYPNLPYYCFPFYMVIEYYKMRQRNLVHFLKVAPIEAFVNILQEKHQLEQEDYNNTVASGAAIWNTGDFAELTVTFKNMTNKRKVKILKIGDITGNCLISSELLLFNLGQSSLNEDTNMQAKLKFISKSDITVADEIEVSLISSSNDISNSIIDCLIKEYFRKPKLIRMNDVFVINIRIFGAEIFYTKPMESNNVENLYFKCSKVVCKDKVYNETCFCILNDTTVKQNANIQSFVPKDNLIVPRRICSNETLLCGLPLVPYGFTEIFNTLKKSVEPFLVNTKLDLHPSFLMTGKKGSGKELLVEALSKTFGMHYYKVTNHDLTANVYAQNETRLRNAFFNAKIASPCILCITNFENFGKNNEGQFDERIMNHFIQELDGLFSNNRYPVILFCLNNERAIPGMLKRSFLETFELKAPHESDRESILKWLLAKFNLIASLDLKEIANKTNGFLFEDLNALVYHAKSEYLKEGLKDSKDTECSICLNEKHFGKALDLMQSTYHESLGAPKVPKVLWSDIGGLTEVKQEIINTINLPLRCPELLKSTGLGRSGILLFGPPGTGKTLIAKAVATECNLCFLSVKGPELLNMYVGQSEENVREVFERAREASPCIIFFDELDSLAPNRGLSGDSGGVMDRVVSQLLAEMDGVNNEGNIFIIGATNRPDLIDPALLRPGRFDKLLYVGPCTDKESKKSVLEALTRKFVLAKDVDLEKIVNSCPTNITGADFYGICANAWTSAVQRVIDRFEKGVKPSEVSLNSDIVTVNKEDFENAIRSVKPSVSRKDILYFEKLKKELT